MITGLVDRYSAELGLLILIGMFAGFVRERFPPTVIAVLGVCVFLMTGLLNSASLLQAFANPAPITIGAMFVLSAALMRTGTLDLVGDWIVRRAKKAPIRASVELVLGLFAAAAFMNNTPVVVIMIPIVLRLAAAISVSAKKLLIPLSYLAMLSGTLTLVGTSTNLLVDGVAQDQGLAPFGIFEITPIGIIVALAGTLALLVLAPFLLPDGDTDPYHSESDRQFLSEARIGRDSPMVGKAVAKVGELKRVQIVALTRGGVRQEVEGRELEAGDRLVLRASLEDLMTLRASKGIDLGTVVVGTVDQALPDVVEATVSPSHPSIGRFARELPFLNSNAVRLLGISRHGHLPGPNLNESRVRAADTVLVTGSPDALRALRQNPHLIGVAATKGQGFRPTKAPIAIGALGFAITVSALGILPIMISALIAVGVVLATRCLDGDEAWNSLNGNVLVLIYGMLAVGIALDQAGSITLVVGALAPLLAKLTPFVLLVVIYLCASVLTEAISNNAVAVIMTPIAIGLGMDLGTDPRPLIIAVMFAASASFATPISYQTNTMVYAAGNYRFADFLRIGLPMNAVVGLTTCSALWLFY